MGTLDLLDKTDVLSLFIKIPEEKEEEAKKAMNIEYGYGPNNKTYGWSAPRNEDNTVTLQSSLMSLEDAKEILEKKPDYAEVTRIGVRLGDTDHWSYDGPFNKHKMAKQLISRLREQPRLFSPLDQILKDYKQCAYWFGKQWRERKESKGEKNMVEVLSVSEQKTMNGEALIAFLFGYQNKMFGRFSVTDVCTQTCELSKCEYNKHEKKEAK